MSARRDRRLLAGVGMLTLVALGAALAPTLAPTDPQSIDAVLAARALPPGATDPAGHWHPLGTDRFGRDLLLRTLVAGRLSLVVGVAGALAASFVGVALGAVAAWRGGAVDMAVRSVSDALLALPRLVLLLVGAALWPPGVGPLLAVLAATGWMAVARLVRADVRQLRSADYVTGAVAVGCPPARLVVRHVLPNALGGALVATTLGIGNAILLESGLSFLGLGVQPPAPSWGNMIAGGRDALLTAPWIALVPGLALLLTASAIALVGDALADRLAGNSAAR